MHWLSTASAWFALSCLLIIAMYILKKRYEPKSISSHLLWRRAMQEQEANKPWQRLKQRLLLWLQLIVAIVIVLSLMQPVIEKQLARDTHLIILLDRSASMATSSGADSSGESYLTTAKHDLGQWIDEHYNGGAVTLITNGDYPSIVLNRAQRKADIEKAITDIEPYYGVSDDETALSLARALVNKEEETVVHYFIDEHFKAAEQSVQQQSAWSEQWHLYAAAANQMDETIRSFTLTEAGQGTRAFVTVLHGTEAEQLEINVAAYNENGKVLRQEKVKKQAQSNGMTTFQIEGLPKAHYYMAELKPHQHDSNLYNNRQYGLLSQQAAYQALLISDGNLFLEKVLQLMNVGVTKLSSQSGVPSKDVLQNIQFVIVDGTYEVLNEQEQWKQLLADFPLWLIDHPEKSESVQLVNKAPVVHEHSITRYFSMEDTYIAAVKQLASSELSGYDVLVEYGGSPAIIAGIKQQKPFLRFAFSLQDSDLPLRAPFPILMMQSIEYMTTGSNQQLGYMLVGSEPTLSLLANTSSSHWQRLAGEQKDGQSKESARSIEIPYHEAIIAPAYPGVYELVEQNEQGNIIQQRTAVVTADSSEFSGSSLASLLKQDTTSAGQDNQPITAAQNANGWSSLIPWLAALLLLLLLGEWEVYRRGL